jgi:hypothetical protein
MPRRIPPPLKPIPTGNEFQRTPVFSRGPDEATTGARDVARFLGPPSKVVDDTDDKMIPNE